MHGQVHVDTALTNISVAYKNQEFIADRVFLPVPVVHQSDRYYVYGLERFNSRDDRRAPGTEAKVSRWTESTDGYFAEGHALKDGVAREKQANADPALDLLNDTTEVLTDEILLNREVNLVAQVTADVTAVDLASIKWDTKSSGVSTNDPIAKIRAQMDVIAKATGVMPNKLALSRPVWTAVRGNTLVTGLVTGAQNLVQGKVTQQQFAELCDLEEVIVASALYNTANPGQTASLDFIWGKKALLYYAPPAPGRKTLALGYHFYWRKALESMTGLVPGQGINGGGAQYVEQYYWTPTKSDIVEVHSYYAQKTIAAAAGSLFTNCIA